MMRCDFYVVPPYPPEINDQICIPKYTKAKRPKQEAKESQSQGGRHRENFEKKMNNKCEKERIIGVEKTKVLNIQ